MSKHQEGFKRHLGHNIEVAVLNDKYVIICTTCRKVVAREGR